MNERERNPRLKNGLGRYNGSRQKFFNSSITTLPGPKIAVRETESNCGYFMGRDDGKSENQSVRTTSSRFTVNSSHKSVKVNVDGSRNGTAGDFCPPPGGLQEKLMKKKQLTEKITGNRQFF